MPASNDLAKQLIGIGISQSYASQLSRKKRKPGLRKAIKIFRRIGVKLGPIERSTDGEIDVIEKALFRKGINREALA